MTDREAFEQWFRQHWPKGAAVFDYTDGAYDYTPVQEAYVAWQAALAYARQESQQGTPSSRWAAEGKSDPHGNRYDCERAALILGHLTDDELANAAFLNYDRRPPMGAILAGTEYMPITYMTAVKERIRWLSRKLVEASQSAPAQCQESDYPDWLKPENAKRHWTEDFPHENGNYQNSCICCGETFLGHKRRNVCKVCVAAPSGKEGE